MSELRINPKLLHKALIKQLISMPCVCEASFLLCTHKCNQLHTCSFFSCNFGHIFTSPSASELYEVPFMKCTDGSSRSKPVAAHFLFENILGAVCSCSICLSMSLVSFWDFFICSWCCRIDLLSLSNLLDKYGLSITNSQQIHPLRTFVCPGNDYFYHTIIDKYVYSLLLRSNSIM